MEKSYTVKEIHDKVAVFLGGIPEDPGPFASQKYHDWNHVMKVIEQIETKAPEYKFIIYPTLVSIYNSNKKPQSTVTLTTLEQYKGLNKLDLVWKNLIDFVDYWKTEYDSDTLEIKTDEKSEIQELLDVIETIPNEMYKGVDNLEPVKSDFEPKNTEKPFIAKIDPSLNKKILDEINKPQLPNIDEYFHNIIENDTIILFIWDGLLRSATVDSKYSHKCFCEVDADDGTYQVSIPKGQILGIAMNSNPDAVTLKGFRSKYVLFKPDHYLIKSRI